MPNRDYSGTSCDVLNCVDASPNTKSSLLPKQLELRGRRPPTACAPRRGASIRHCGRGGPCRNSPACPRCFVCGLQVETVSTILTKQRAINSGWKDGTGRPRGLVRDGRPLQQEALWGMTWSPKHFSHRSLMQSQTSTSWLLPSGSLCRKIQ